MSTSAITSRATSDDESITAATASERADLSVIVVTHNSSDFIVACLDAVMASDFGGRLEVIVVDNRSEDDTVARIRERYADVNVLTPTTRGGFARNVNVGISAATGRRLLILNPDTQIEIDAIRIASDYLDANPEVGLAGCRLEDERGRRETSFRGFPTLWTAACELFLFDRLFPRSRLFARRTMTWADPELEHRVDWITGAFILARREVVDGTESRPAAGYLDERFFLFVEDAEWCRRACDVGWQVAYVPTARAVHHKGSGHGWDPWRYRLNCQGTARYFGKHHGAGSAALYQLLLVPGLLLRAALTALPFDCPGVPRDDQAHRIRGYLTLALSTMSGRLGDRETQV